MATRAFYPQPVAGVRMKPPLGAPAPGHVILGYELVQAQPCQCEYLSASGWLAVILLLIIFWPLAWIPCVMSECYESYQYPVYGAPGGGPHHPGGPPPQQYQQPPPGWSAPPPAQGIPTAQPVPDAYPEPDKYPPVNGNYPQATTPPPAVQK